MSKQSFTFTAMEEEVIDDYVRYPLKEGEEPIFENLTYSDFLNAAQSTNKFWKEEDELFKERVLYRLR